MAVAREERPRAREQIWVEGGFTSCSHCAAGTFDLLFSSGA